jgi:putative transposase
MMDDYESVSLSHSKWEYKYHVVFIPKCVAGRRFMGNCGNTSGDVPQTRDAKGEPRKVSDAGAHLTISIPPKCPVSQVIGYIKGKSAIHLARVYGERKRNFTGQHFWARGTSSQRSVATKP